VPYLAGITEITRTLQPISLDLNRVLDCSTTYRCETHISNDFDDPVARIPVGASLCSNIGWPPVLTSRRRLPIVKLYALQDDRLDYKTSRSPIRAVNPDGCLG
jgi:hypothetical protein